MTSQLLLAFHFLSKCYFYTFIVILFHQLCRFDFHEYRDSVFCRHITVCLEVHGIVQIVRMPYL